MLAGAGAVRAAAEDGSGTLLKGKAAFGSWQQDKPGLRRLIKPQDLPPVGKSTPNFSEVAPMPPGAKPRVPPGFLVEMVASGYAGPRAIRVAPNGDLFFADSASNSIHVLRVPSGTASPTKNEVFASGLTQPFGIAFYPLGPNPEWVYVANSDGVVRFPYKNGDLIATGKPEQIVGNIPWVHHWARDIAFTPDGKRLLLSVGSGSNVALDMFPEPEVKGGLQAWIKSEPLGAAWDTEERRADVLSYDPHGKNEKILATGLRNCAGITIQPATGLPWCVVNERDELGDNTPFEYATAVKDSAFYGWPWYYIGSNEDPRHKGARPDLKGKVTVPDVLMQAHSAPLQIVFYEGNDFPASYKGSAFVALHGSWNRAERTGYKVVRLLFDNAGKPTGEYEDFLTGFVISDKQVWGRPVGVAVAKDGSLFVTEDGNGTIWRVSHQKVASNN
ncbi:MAG TPA: PQQ-dependent sugar dehydrogenase [Bradyrhizobium sp.]|nr:PQQ-dependent sugar dehydrogenase [Bradyrhizobium sp.]